MQELLLQRRLTESSPVKRLHSKSCSVTIEQRANSLLCDKDLMITGNPVKSCDKRAHLHPLKTQSMTESALGKWQIVQAKQNKPSGEVKKISVTKSHLRSGT